MMVDDIRRWLEELGLGKYADAFEENLVDAAVLPSLIPWLGFLSFPKTSSVAGTPAFWTAAG